LIQVDEEKVINIMLVVLAFCFFFQKAEHYYSRDPMF